jgi:hypothetical protein
MLPPPPPFEEQSLMPQPEICQSSPVATGAAPRPVRLGPPRRPGRKAAVAAGGALEVALALHPVRRESEAGQPGAKIE